MYVYILAWGCPLREPAVTKNGNSKERTSLSQYYFLTTGSQNSVDKLLVAVLQHT